MLLTWILGFSLLGSVGAVGAAALFLVCPERMRQRLIPYLLSYAVGTLLGAAFLGMLPHALEHATVSSVAVADLIPHLHRHLELTSSLAQLLLLGAGIGTILLLH